MSVERAETYLRDLAESDLRRYRGGAPQDMPAATARVRAVAAAFTRIEALDPGIADGVIDDLTTALELRSSGDPQARSPVARLRRARRVPPRAVTSAGPGPVSVTPIGELLELRDGETDIDVYLSAAIGTPMLTFLSVGVLSLPKGSLPRRGEKRPGPPAVSPTVRHGGIPGVPLDLRAVDDTGETYHPFFNGGGDGTWATGHFNLMARPRPHPPPGLPPRTWLDVGDGEHSVRVDLSAAAPAAEVTVTGNGLSAGEQFLRIRAETLFASGHHDVGTGLSALAALVPALRAVGVLPQDSVYARRIAGLCHRYAVRHDIPDPPAALPERWADVLTGGQHDSWPEADGASPPPALAHLPVVFPETDGVSTVLSGLVTRGRRTTVTGAVFGAVEEGYAEGPCIWLRDDGGLWHVAKPRNWSSGEVNVFGASVFPPVAPSASSAEILVINRTADVRAAVPLTWWTS